MANSTNSPNKISQFRPQRKQNFLLPLKNVGVHVTTKITSAGTHPNKVRHSRITCKLPRMIRLTNQRAFNMSSFTYGQTIGAYLFPLVGRYKKQCDTEFRHSQRAHLLSSSCKLVEVEMKPCGEANVPVGFIFH